MEAPDSGSRAASASVRDTRTTTGRPSRSLANPRRTTLSTPPSSSPVPARGAPAA